MTTFELSLYDAIEIDSIHVNNIWHHPCSPEEATYWSVFLHLKEGGRDSVLDFNDEAGAKAFGAWLRYELDNNPSTTLTVHRNN